MSVELGVIWANLLAAFLDTAVRMQAVGINGRLSNLMSVVSGFPQGTVLGLCLFLIHLMVISNNISSETTASSFADDTCLQRGITSEIDCEALQDDCDIGMIFNAGKFKLLQFWLDRDEVPNFLYMTSDGGPIEEKDCL